MGEVNEVRRGHACLGRRAQAPHDGIARWLDGPRGDRVQDVMSRRVLTVCIRTAVADVERLAREREVSKILVSDGAILVGILCICDLRDSEPSSPILRFMSTPVVCASPDETIQGAAARMRSYEIGVLPVTEHGDVVGVVTQGDLARAGLSIDLRDRRRCDACRTGRHVREDTKGRSARLCSDCLDRSGPPNWHEDIGGSG